MSKGTAILLISIALCAAVAGGTYRYAFHVEAQKSVEKPREDHADDAVVLSEAKIAEAGIELATAEAVVLRDSVVLNGILQPNQESLVQVTPRFPGIIRELAKRVGDRVEKNDLLGKIESNQSLTVYELRAPIGGTVIERQAALGEFASDQKPSFVIADLGSVWVDMTVYRRDLGRLRVGNPVLIDPEDGGPAIEAKLAYISPVGSADTQSVLARAVVANPEQRLRPGLFVTGRVLLPEKPVPLAVKSSALQSYENKTVVFVRAGERFEARPVELGAQDAEHTEIRQGLRHGEIYAAANSFIVKAELGKGTAAHED